MLTPENIELISILSVFIIGSIVWFIFFFSKSNNTSVTKFSIGHPYLKVCIEFPDLKIYETVIIKDFSIFEIIMPDVILHSWEYYNSDGAEIAGCSGPNSTHHFSSFFEKLTTTQMNVSFSN